MYKLVRGNLVRGLPSKLFENDHICVACQKEKQHKASCKTKLVSSISQPLQMLHMDLFGPTSVRSINHKTYCLVVTDDYSRFCWVLFFATKDETSGILKTFITGIENQINHKVKIIRCDNGTEFKNNDMNLFYGMKGIKREFSIARTSQQNEVAERKNRTLIEAARTMLADSLLPTTFGLKYRPPSISFMRPFGCYVTILNTLDPLGKFDRKADEGFLVGYSINSKAFRVFNTRTRKVEENLHINFLKNKPNVVGSGTEWLFDTDSLTKSMNYEPSSKDAVVADANEEPTHKGERNGQEKEGGALNKENGQNVQDFKAGLDNLLVQQKEGYANNTNRDCKFSPSVSTAGIFFTNTHDLPTDPLIPDLEETGIFSGAYDDEDVGPEVDLNNLEITMNVSPIPTTRIYMDHPKDQIIGDINLATQTRRMTKIFEEHAMMMHKRFQMSSMRELTFFLGLQVQQKEDGIFISQNKYVTDILKKFDFVTVKTTNTPIQTNKALLKDEEAKDVDVHLYRSMIRSLMYLTASSDYARARLDRKSTIGGYQFLGKRLISWQCKKQTIIANSTTEAKYVAVANCCGQNPVFHSKTKHIGIRHHFIRDSYEKNLIQVIKIHTDHNVTDLLTKAFDVSRSLNEQSFSELSSSVQSESMKKDSPYSEAVPSE
ncbi:putative ribonuclease H-like domain-containing protein [Tanacetum coccineum]